MSSGEGEAPFLTVLALVWAVPLERVALGCVRAEAALTECLQGCDV